MKKKWFLIIVGLLTLINLAAFSRLAYRQWCAHSETKACPRQEIEAEKILVEKLGLRDEQIAPMRALRLKFNQDAAQSSADMERERMALTNLLMAPETDSAAIERVMTRIDSLQSNLQRQVVHNLLAQKTYLNKNQQQLFFALILHSCAMNSNTCINQEPCTNQKE